MRARVAAVTALAVLLTLMHLVPSSASADVLGTPPKVIDYNTVPVADWPALQRIETKAAEEVLQNHALPSGDLNAVLGWGRNEVRTQLWVDMVRIIKKDAAQRTSDEHAAYRWLQTLVQKQNIAAARASIDEYLRYSGLTEATYRTSQPVNYNNPDKSAATGGYCLYRAPGIYADDYTGYIDQTCYTPGTGLANYAVPMPSYEQFLSYGQYKVLAPVVSNLDFSNVAASIAASAAAGAALAAAGVTIPLSLSIALVADGIFPWAVYGGTIGAVAVGAVASATATAVLFVVVMVVASIQLDTQLNMGQRLYENWQYALSTPPDLQAGLRADDAALTFPGLTDEQRKPKWYPGLFTMLLTGTLPEATPEPCDSGLVIGGSAYRVGCVNSPAPASIAAGDPVFRVTKQGSSTFTDQRFIAADDPYRGGATVTRASGHGWFVQSPSFSRPTIQSLDMRFTGWDGRAYVAARIWDGTDGDRFVVTPVGAGADSADASVTDTLQLTVSGGTKVSAKLVADSRPVNAGSVPETVDVYEAATFSAPGEADASYKWWFPTKDLSSNSFGVQGIPPGYQSADGATVTHSFIQTGLVTAYLAKTTADGAYTVTSYPINVLETRWADRITVDGPTTVRLGESVTPTITTASGLPFTVSQAGISCGAVYSGGSFEALRADAPGTCTFVVKTLGNADYAPASLTGAFEIYRGEQTITVGDWASLPVGDTEAIPATASSGLPVTATVVPESSTVCSVSGATVSALASGTCSLVLTQAGNSSYLPAVPATTSFAVTRGQQSITIEPLDDLTYGESQPVVASSSASAPVTIAIDPASAAICSYDAETGAITAVGVGTCRVTADQDGDDDYLPAPQASSEFAVTPAPLSVTAEDTSMQYGGATPEFTYTVSPSIAVAGVVCETTDPLTAGDHPIVCSGGDAGPDYAIEYVSGTLTVTPAPATVTVTPAEVQYSDPVPDLDVSWSVDGLLGSDTLTGELSGCRADGLDIDQGRVTSSAGAYPLSGCDGLGNPNYRVSYEGAVNVERETSTLSYDGEWYVSTVDAAGSDTGSGTASLAATVAQADDGSDGDVTKATVDFLLFSSGNTSNTPTASMTGVAVDSLGHASAQAPGLAPDVYRVVVRVSPTNGYFTGPITTDQLAVYQPVRGASASGGGWMADPGSADGRGQFGLSVRYGKEREPQGSATFSWVDPDTGYQYLLASDSWQGGDLAIAGARVSLTATASLTVTDPRTRKVIDALSGGHRTIRVVATDGGKGGQNDDVAVTALSPSGQVLHAVSTTSIGGGNVTVSR